MGDECLWQSDCRRQRSLGRSRHFCFPEQAVQGLSRRSERGATLLEGVRAVMMTRDPLGGRRSQCHATRSDVVADEAVQKDIYCDTSSRCKLGVCLASAGDRVAGCERESMAAVGVA